MNKTAIKNFAVWARNKLIADISYRAGLIGITESGIASALPQSTGTTEFYDIGTAEPYSISGDAVRQRRRLVELIERKEKETDYKTAYKYIIEEVAYTWFNRLIAIRFMEVNDYLPSHIRVLSSESGKMEPDLVTTPFEADLEFSQDEERMIIKLKNDNELDELFKFLFIKQCNSLNEVLPALFERTKDYSELLLNLSVIDKEGVVYHLVNDIPEADFDIERGGQIEIIGWLYQFYNIEPKAEVFSKKGGKLVKEEIPAATQLFTPDWIVRYMVENSLGRFWLDGDVSQEIKKNWQYYINDNQQKENVSMHLQKMNKMHISNPEDIKVVDPCMGSGHILVYCFDVLMQIYESQGYAARDAAQLILTKNIYGLDIDKRAVQLSYFAIMMKARQYDRRIFSRGINPNVFVVQESNEIDKNCVDYFVGSNAKLKKIVDRILSEMHNAKEYGSITKVSEFDFELLRQRFDEIAKEINIYSYAILNELYPLVVVAQVLSQKYDVVCTNPPYLGSDAMGAQLASYVKKHYTVCKADLFAVFMDKCGKMLNSYGYQAMITMHSWMFLSSFEKLRDTIVNNNTIVNMCHLGARAFEEISGEIVQTVAWIMKNGYLDYNATYVRLVDYSSQDEKRDAFLANENRYTGYQNNFTVIPGAPIAYWISEGFQKIFNDGEQITKYVSSRDGLTTGDNEKFIKQFWEVPFHHIAFGCNDANQFWKTERKYAPLIKGGLYRKWYGNNWFVITYDKAGYERLSQCGNKLPSREIYFKPYMTWNRISTRMAFRYCERGYLFESASLVAYSNEMDDLMYALSFANSVVARSEMQLINPTTNMLSGYVDSLRIPRQENMEECVRLAKECVSMTKADWDAYETSWDFSTHPLLVASRKNAHAEQVSLSEAFSVWSNECEERFIKLRENEEQINNIFVKIYNLENELNVSVEDKDISVRKADLQRDIRSLISYAVGCMFGRYSLDCNGIVYAGEEWMEDKYCTFIPDKDNCIPVTDEEYFEDDIVGLFTAWMKKAFGLKHLEENLDFVASALNNKGKTTREIIRNYFLNDFIKDHVKTYQKRPIYWMFDSGKENGFKALVYMHRWNADTVGNLRIDYLHRVQRTYESENNRMQDMIEHSTNAREVATATKRKEKLQKQLKECREYDEKIGHLALSRIEIDLDDGVKVNYEKVQTASDGKKYQVLAKI